MSDDDLEMVHGSGNVFRDLGLANPEALQLKAILAAKIVGVLDALNMSVRSAHDVTGFPLPIFRVSGKPSSRASRLIASWRCWKSSIRTLR